MAADGDYALRIPTSLIDDVRAAADRRGVSLTSFIIQAAADKVATLKAQGALQPLSPEEQAAYLEARAARVGPQALRDLVARAGTTAAVLPGDEVPEAWLDGIGPDTQVGTTSNPAGQGPVRDDKAG